MKVATPSFFAGRWRMARIVETDSDGAIGTFRGEAEFRPMRIRDGFGDDVREDVRHGAGLICREAGVLRFRGADYRAARGALWRFPGGGRIEVRHEDGRPFHEFAVGDPQAVHRCGADRYRVHYDFGGEIGGDRWGSVWDVEGPGKAYRMITRYRRIGPRRGPAEGFNPPEGRAPPACAGRATR